MGQKSKPANAGTGSEQIAGTKKRRSQVNLRLTADEKSALKTRAERAGLNVSSYLLALGLRRHDAQNGASADFTDHDSKATTHEASLKHLGNWSKILEQQEVDIAELRSLLKLHLGQAAAEWEWQQEALRLGQQLVQATKLGASTSVLQQQTNDLCRKLRQHLRQRP